MCAARPAACLHLGLLLLMVLAPKGLYQSWPRYQPVPACLSLLLPAPLGRRDYCSGQAAASQSLHQVRWIVPQHSKVLLVRVLCARAGASSFLAAFAGGRVLCSAVTVPLGLVVPSKQFAVVLWLFAVRERT